MIILSYLYLSDRYKRDTILEKCKYLVFFSLIFFLRLDLLIISSIFYTISIIDLLEHKIPNELNISLFLIGLFFVLIDKNGLYLSFTIESFIIFIFLFILTIISLSTNMIGFADIKLLTILTIIKGSRFIINMSFFLSIILFIFSIILLIKYKNTKKEIPLGPFIYMAFLINSLI